MSKEQIKSAIQNFSQGNLTENALNLFKTLGYNTERQAPLARPDYAAFKDSFMDGQSRFNEDKALVKEWRYVDLLFQLSKEEVLKQTTLFDTRRVDNTVIESYLFFAVELSRPHYSRTELSHITREINRLFPMPVMLLFKHGETLTLSVINRRLHKRDEGRDVLEKVTLIKDIRIDNPHRAHIEILFDLASDELLRKHRFTNFVELHNAWQKTLDTKELNKRFFQELANWFFWAQSHVQFPNDRKIEEKRNHQINLIRLITRLIFVWFLKEKRLVEERLFDKAFIRKMLKDFDPDSEKTRDYYPAILQNLFFGTLNQKMNERGFVVEGSHNEHKEHYGVKTLYRYAALFNISKDEVVKLFKDIPFLNGGLFDCLDKENEETSKVEYVDGFSRNSKKVPFVPDCLFFGKERIVDLTESYGFKKNNEKFRGIIEIFEDYKFTIEENTPIEEEIALDPELLGKVFENLLAYYNPETESTARKQTGSFYTPREIVNYMVDESLIAYLKTQLFSVSTGYIEFGAIQTKLFADEGVGGQLTFTETTNKSRWSGKEDELETALRHLIHYNNDPHPFNEQEVQRLIFAVDHCKILDPACGSGAFPMGVLHKLVYLLGKLDEKNLRWRELQKMKAIRDTEEAFNIGDIKIREDKLMEINETFENNAGDYGRKLYLIENCIYGVDIQAIAVQISKLRFFISLVVDQKEREWAENRGIRPLPNLETKFVAANTLIGLDKPTQLVLMPGEIETLKKELRHVRHQHFEAKSRKEKLQCQKRDKAIRQKIAALLKSSGWANKDADRIARFDIYDQNASADFFDAEWMFGISPSPSGRGQGEGGFDIVIGNPPYVSHDKIKEKKEIKGQYLSYEPFADIYCYFIECAINLQKKQGLLCYITSNSYLRSDYGKPIRNLLKEKNDLLEIINIEDSQVFESAIVNVAILIAARHTSNRKSNCHVVNSPFQGDESFERFAQREGFDYPQNIFTDKPWSLLKPKLFLIQKKIERNNKTLEQLGTKIRLGLATGHNEAFIVNETKKKELCELQASNAEIIRPILRGRDISRFNYKLSGLYILLAKNGVDVRKDYPFIYNHLESFGEGFKKRGAQGQHWANLRACSFFDDFNKEKIIWIELADVGRFALCKEEVYLLNSAYFLLPPNGVNSLFLLGILNSSVIRFYLGLIAETSGMGTSRWINNFVKEFPIPDVPMDKQQPIVKLVDQILAAKQKDPKADTSALEKQIDKLVYALYGLTPEEIAVVEGKG